MVSDIFPKEVLELFCECQKTKVSHGRLVKNLLKVYKQLGVEKFWAPFLKIIQIACRQYDRSSPVERLIAFIVKFVLEASEVDMKNENRDENDDGFGVLLSRLFEFCLQYHTASGHGVRFRCVQLLSHFLEGMGSDAMLSEATFFRIQEALFKRIWDVKPFVRAEATRALARLQDPTDRDCPVVTAFLYLMRHDASADVRKTAVQSLAITTRSLPEVLTCTRDVSDLVRRTAFDVIVDKMSMKPLTIAKRIKILRDGMNDRSPIVRTTVSQRLLPSWLTTTENSPVRLLKALDVEGSPEVCEKAIRVLLSGLDKEGLQQMIQAFVSEYLDSEQRVPVVDRLCSESSFFWCVLVEHLREMGSPEGEELLEQCLPLGKALSSFLRGLLEKYQKVPDKELEQRLENEFVISHIINLAQNVDLSDEFGRQALKGLIRDCLIAPNSLVCSGLVTVLLDLLMKIEPKVVESNLIEEVVEMISELRDPMIEEESPAGGTILEATLPASQETVGGASIPAKMDRKLEIKLASIRVTMNELKEELDHCVSKMDFEAAGPLRDKLRALEEEKSRLLAKTGKEDEKAKEDKNSDGDEESDDEEEGGDAEEKDLLSDADTLIKANTIAVELLKRVKKVGSLTPSLRTLVTSLILPSIQNADPAVRNIAVTTLGLVCILDRGLARKYLPLFVQISRVDHVAIRVSGLKSMFDCFLAYGLDSFTDINIDGSIQSKMEDEIDKETTLGAMFREDSDDIEVKSVAASTVDDEVSRCTSTGQTTSKLSFVIELLDCEAAEIRTVCVEGLARLIYLGHVVSSKLLSRLLLLWFNPLTEEDARLRHCLALFFPYYCFAKCDNQACMAEAVLPTLRTIFRAPITSPLAKVDAWNVASLMMHLTDSSNLFKNKMNNSGAANRPTPTADETNSQEDKENFLAPDGEGKPKPAASFKSASSTVKSDNPCHDELALRISNVLLDNAEPAEMRIFVRMITNLRLSPVNLLLRKELYFIIHNVIERNVLERQQLRMLRRFHGALKVVLEAEGVDTAALLVKEKKVERTPSLSEESDRRMMTLLAEETKRRKKRRSSFTRALCGSDEEPTLLETTVVNIKGENLGKFGNSGSYIKPNLNATVSERTYLGSKFGNVLNRGNLSMASQDVQSNTILVEISDEDHSVSEEGSDDELNHATCAIDDDAINDALASPVSITRVSHDTSIATLKSAAEEQEDETSSTLTPSQASAATETSTMKEEDAEEVQAARTQRRRSRPSSERRSSARLQEVAARTSESAEPSPAASRDVRPSQASHRSSASASARTSASNSATTSASSNVRRTQARVPAAPTASQRRGSDRTNASLDSSVASRRRSLRLSAESGDLCLRGGSRSGSSTAASVPGRSRTARKNSDESVRRSRKRAGGTRGAKRSGQQGSLDRWLARERRSARLSGSSSRVARDSSDKK